MKMVLIRGVPRGLVRDAWWMAPGEPSGAADGGTVPGPEAPRWGPLLVLVGLVALGDAMIWQVADPGLSLVVFVLAIAGAGLAMMKAALRDRRALVWAGSGLALGLLPLIELVQTLSVAFALLALAHALVWLALGAYGSPGRTLRAVGRFPLAAMRLLWRDRKAVLQAGRTVRPGWAGFSAILRDWGLSIGLGLVFVVLLASANPVLDVWLSALFEWPFADTITKERMAFWGIVALMLWPALRLSVLGGLLNHPVAPRRAGPVRPGVFNPNSVMRALIVFNVLFAVQSGLDAGYLWGGLSLPEGMTHANYAHRGAYPLLVTALLAGLFALLCQPHMVGRRHLRWLLLLWILQNVLLAASSALRLELYVEAYGLTRLRFAAFLWIALVAAGLGLMLLQLKLGRSPAWLLLRAGVMGIATFYAVCFVNVAGVVAEHNLSRFNGAVDIEHLCGLGEGAVPAIVEHGWQSEAGLCYVDLLVKEPQGWREWGYRNARLRRSLPVRFSSAPSGEAS